MLEFRFLLMFLKGVPDDEDEGLDEGASTCFLCHLTFKNSELTAQHLHHVHMKWVKRTVRSADKAPEVATQVRLRNPQWPRDTQQIQH